MTGTPASGDAFGKRLTEIAEKAAALGNPVAFSDFLCESQAEIKDAIDDYHDKLKSLSVWRVIGVLANFFDIGQHLGYLLSSANDPLLALYASLGIVIKAGAAFGALRRAHAEHAEVVQSDWRYLSLLEKEFPRSYRETT